MPEKVRKYRPATLMAACALVAMAMSATAVETASAIPPSSDPTGYGPVQSNGVPAFLSSLLNPGQLPQGVNDWSCKPSAAHPKPLIMVNGTFGNMYTNWSYYAPTLKADGYCLFTLNYNGATGSPFQQTGNMRASALELSAFTDEVLAATGSTKVDMIGHSQGGLLPLYYINILGGDAKVDTFVPIDGAVHGVSFYGVLSFLTSNLITSSLVGLVLPAGVDFAEGSEFVRTMSADGFTRPAVRYVSVTSRFDLLVQPPEAGLPPAPNVRNVIIQDSCAQDFADHLTVLYDDIALRLVRNALDPANSVAPTCHFVAPLLNSAPMAGTR